MSDSRSRFEDVSRGPLVVLSRIPKALIIIGLAALLVGGLMLPVPWGPICLVLIGLFLGWLLALSWPAIPGSSRMLRLLTVLLVFCAAYLRASGRG